MPGPIVRSRVGVGPIRMGLNRSPDSVPVQRAVLDPGPTGQSAPEPTGHRATILWIGYLTFGAVLAAFYFALPRYHLLLWTPLGLSSVAATLVGVRLHRPRQPLAWWFVAAAEFCFITGDTLYNVLTQVLHQQNPFPSVADVFYLLTYPLFATAIFLLIRSRSSSRDQASLIDAVIITTGLGLLSWVYLIVPNFQVGGLTGPQRFISVAYPLGDVLILAMLARLVGAGGGRIRAMQFLVVGAGGLMVADVLYGLIQLNGAWSVGGPVDLGWVAFYVAWGCAALHPSMARVSERLPRRTPTMGRLRAVLLASVSLIAPAVLLLESVTRHVVHAKTVAVFSASMFILVIARLLGILSVHQHAVRREGILRASSEALVVAQELSEIFQVALDGVASLIPSSDGADVGIYLTAEGSLQIVAGTARPPLAHVELWQLAAAGGGLTDTGEISVAPLRYDLKLRGMLVVAAPTPLNLDQHRALSMLATQVGLAVESAKLAADLRQRQTEARFRTILQNTSDIIVIVDVDGKISYATPSMSRHLGRSRDELIGQNLTQFLVDADAAAAMLMFAGFSALTRSASSVTDWRLRREDGGLVAFEVLSTNLLDDSSVAGIVLTMRDVSERRELEGQLKHQAFHDALTGLPNRALFQDRAEHALARTSRQGTLVAMVMLDLDDFKLVNDTLGHAAGDELLLQVARRLQSTLRVDATVSRFGGDEFAILLEDLADAGQAERFAARALTPFDAPFTVQGEELTVRASLGLVLAGAADDPTSMSELMRCADLALYAAKERGKAQVVRYHPELHTRMVDRLTRRSDLERAIDASEFVVHYQPIVAIETGEVVGSEALVRWRHPTRGLVPPVEFIELAEETGLIVPLGRWVLNQALAQARHWESAGAAGLRLSVNVSARQLAEPGFVQDVRSALREHDVNPAQLVLELTESLFALEAPGIREQITTLREFGVKIAMDDFGTGYSSLSYLQNFQLDILKVDKSFVDGLIEGNADGAALVNAIISLAHSLRLEVVAEGVEHINQRDELWSMGCNLGQGYLYSRPIDAQQLLSLLQSLAQLGPRTSAGQRDLSRLRLPALRPGRLLDTGS